MENENENQLQKIDPNSPAGLMSQLMDKEGAFDVEGFGKMLEFQEKHEANQARKAYAFDFTTVQTNIAAVGKAKHNSQTNSKYADLEAVLEMAKPVYTEQGFSVIFHEGKAEKTDDIRLCADVLHRSGHKETYHIDVPPDETGIKGSVNKTKMHGKASSVTYARRYLMCMIWNIPTQDSDGNGDKKKKPVFTKPTKQEMKVIAAICEKLPPVEGKIVDEKKVTALLFTLCKKYPKDMADVGAATEFLVKKNKPEMYKDAEGDDLGDIGNG